MAPAFQLSKQPFPWGAHGLHVRRLLLITDADSCVPKYRPLHPSQFHLSDEQLPSSLCVFSDDFSLLTPCPLAEESDTPWRGHGLVRAVVYRVMALRNGHPIALGDTDSLEAACQLMRYLSFQPAFARFCWEISSAHLDADTLQWLEDLADHGVPTGLMFEAFRIPSSPAIGVKLMGTPWTDEHLEATRNFTAQVLWNDHVEAEIPMPLLALMHLAGEAGTRLLIFDHEAPVQDSPTLFNK